MLVVGLVTAVALARRGAIGKGLVAGLAFDLGVPSRQAEARAVVVEAFDFPAAFRVAVAARASELALVLVVFRVTRIAVAAELVVIEIAGVAGVALRERMLRQQRVAGVAVMPEDHVLAFPRRCRVAGGAAFAVARLVLVVLLVTGDAFARRALEAPGVLVAVAALDIAMLAKQRKGRRVVIEAGFAPAAFDVTVGA